MAGTIRSGGLGSGLDTNTIVDSLVKIESGAVTAATKQQAAFKNQLSALGSLISKLQSLGTASTSLGTTGVLGVAAVGTYSGFSATPGTAASAGSYAIQVTGLAQAAKARSQAFTAPAAAVSGGTLTLSINGTATPVTINDGDSLSTVANSINASGAAVTASVVTSSTGSYLTFTNRGTGFTVGQPASSALTITETTTGVLGQPLAAASTQTASNATFTVDGLTFERTSNTVSDVLPGTTLALTKLTAAPENLVLNNDVAATQKSLQTFIDAYNAAMGLVHGALAIPMMSDRSQTLGGDASVRSLQAGLQRLVTSQANPGSSVRTLADLGVKTGTDGSLAIDANRLSKAIGTDPAAVNALFQTATTGISAAASALVKSYTNDVDGVLSGRSTGLNRSIKQLDSTISNAQRRVDAFKERLISQYAAMEKIVSQFKAVGSYLTQQANANAKNG